MTAFRLRFDDPDLEQHFLSELESSRSEYVQAGFGFLVLFFGAVAASQVYFARVPLATNLIYAGLGLAALFAFSFYRPRTARHRSRRLHCIVATFIMAGAVLAVLAPGASSGMQLMAAATTLTWFGLLSGAGPGWIRRLLGFGMIPALAVATAVCWVAASRYALTLCGLLLATGFTWLTVYVYERRARHQYMHRQRALQPAESAAPAPVEPRRESATRVIRPDKGFQLIKELTIELSGVSDADELYTCLLRYFKRAVPHRLAAVGRLQNDRMLPVLVRTEDGKNGIEDTTRQFWRSQLVGQLRQAKSPLAGDAEMGLLDSDVRAGEINFGYRLDIPFFSQGRLDGVVTLLRSQPSFSDAETALAAGMVFHGLFAHRSARLQRQLEKIQHRTRAGSTAPADSKPTLLGKPANGVLSVDEFLRQANDAFEEARSRGTPVSLLLIELDQHEQLAEQYGAAASNRAFEAVARLVAGHCVPGSILGRYGEGSFAMQLPLPLNEAKAVAERLRAAIRRRPLRTGSTRLEVSVSVGISARDSAVDFLSLLRGADIGLYLARDGEGNSVRVHH